MHKKYIVINLPIILFMAFSFLIPFSGFTQKLILNRKEYKDKLMGFWLGECIGNWTGLPTENERVNFPFFTDSDFRKGKFFYVLDEILGELMTILI